MGCKYVLPFSKFFFCFADFFLCRSFLVQYSPTCWYCFWFLYFWCHIPKHIPGEKNGCMYSYAFMLLVSILLFELKKTSFSISCKAGLVCAPSVFAHFRKSISPSFLNDSFAGWSILGWHFFSSSILNLSIIPIYPGLLYPYCGFPFMRDFFFSCCF